MVSCEGRATRREAFAGSEEGEGLGALDQNFLVLQELLGWQRTGWCSVFKHMGGDWVERVERKI